MTHIIAFNHHDPTRGGLTIAENLHPLCRAHHRAKTHGLWSVTRDPTTGITTWTSPTHHTYTTTPDDTH